MIALKNKPNVIAPTSTYPHGKLKDDTGIGDGTPVNQQTNNDIHSFFQQLMVDAGLTPNNILDNEYDGFQLNLALGLWIGKLTKNYDEKLQPWLTTGLSYNTGWAGTGGDSDFKYKLTLNNIVKFRGTLIKSSQATDPELMVTLPVGIRPATKKLFVVSSFANTAKHFQVEIRTDGSVYYHSDGFDINPSSVQMDPVQFEVA